MSDFPLTAWDNEVARICREAGADENTARNFVAIKWLHAGDKRPLVDFFLHLSFKPEHELVRLLMLMLVDNKTIKPTAWPRLGKLREQLKRLPYQLVLERRPGVSKEYKTVRRPEKVERDRAAVELYERLRAQGVKPEQAKTQTLSQMEGTGVGVEKGTETLKKAIARYGKKKRKRLP